MSRAIEFDLQDQSHAVEGDPTDNAISIRRVTQTFSVADGEVTALDSIDLEVPRGKFLVLLGPSGCGKTTLLRIIGGFISPTTGSVRVDGLDLWDGAQRNGEALANLGMVFQEANLFPWANIEDNVALPLALRGTPKEERLARAHELCRLVGIDGFEQRWPRELSGGMRQRAAIGRALSYDPDILLMDEPFGALDAMTRDQMNLELQRIWMEGKANVVFVTHSIPEAVFLADRIILLSPRPGRITLDLRVNFPRPRSVDLLTSSDFQDVVRHLRTELESS